MTPTWGGQDDGIIGRKGGSKRIVVLAIEKKGKGVSRMYARVIDSASKENLKGFMKDHIKKEAMVRTDKWAGYKRMREEFPNIVQEESEKKGRNFVQLHRCILMFKVWLRGAHHSVKHLQSHINDYTYRFNRHTMKEGILENLLARMMKTQPHAYKMIIT